MPIGVWSWVRRRWDLDWRATRAWSGLWDRSGIGPTRRWELGVTIDEGSGAGDGPTRGRLWRDHGWVADDDEIRTIRGWWVGLGFRFESGSFSFNFEASMVQKLNSAGSTWFRAESVQLCRAVGDMNDSAVGVKRLRRIWNWVWSNMGSVWYWADSFRVQGGSICFSGFQLQNDVDVPSMFGCRKLWREVCNCRGDDWTRSCRDVRLQRTIQDGSVSGMQSAWKRVQSPLIDIDITDWNRVWIGRLVGAIVDCKRLVVHTELQWLSCSG